VREAGFLIVMIIHYDDEYSKAVWALPTKIQGGYHTVLLTYRIVVLAIFFPFFSSRARLERVKEKVKNLCQGLEHGESLYDRPAGVG